MSTKIYNGYKVNLNSFYELRQFYEKISPILKQKQLQEIGKRAAQIACTIIDFDQYGFDYSNYFVKNKQNKTFTGQLYYLIDDFLEEKYNNILKTNIRDPQYDFSIRIAFIPLEDKILSLFYSECQAFEKHWFKFNEVEYYGYWNNTDRDEDCTEEEWNQRDLDWEKALPGIGYVPEHAVYFDHLNKKPNLHLNYIIQNVPSNEKRAREIAENLMWNKYVNENKNELSRPDRGYYSFINSIDKGGILHKDYIKLIEKIALELQPLTIDLLRKDIEYSFSNINTISDI
jgi:hypothetical protein